MSPLYSANKTRTKTHLVQNNNIIALAVETWSYEILIISILLVIFFIFFWVNYVCIIPIIQTVYHCGWVKLLRRVFKKSRKVPRRVLKKVGKVRVGLNKIGLSLVGEKCQSRFNHFFPTISSPIRYFVQYGFIKVCIFYRFFWKTSFLCLSEHFVFSVCVFCFSFRAFFIFCVLCFLCRIGCKLYKIFNIA